MARSVSTTGHDFCLRVVIMKFDWSNRTFRWSVIGFLLFVILVTVIMIVRYRRSKYKYPDQVTADTDTIRQDLSANTSFQTCLTDCSNKYLTAQYQGQSDSTPPKAECIASCTSTYINTRCPYATTRLTPSVANGDAQSVVDAYTTYKNTDMASVASTYISLSGSAPSTSTTSIPSLTVVQAARKADLTGPTRKYLSTVCTDFYTLPDGSVNPRSIYTAWAPTSTAPTTNPTATATYRSGASYGFYTGVTAAHIITWAKRAGQPLKIASSPAATAASTQVTVNVTFTGLAANIPVNFPKTYKGSPVSSTNPFPVILLNDAGTTTILATMYYSSPGTDYGSGSGAISWATLPTFTLTIPAQTDASKQVSINGWQVCIAPSVIYVTTATSAGATSLTINSTNHNIPSTYNGVSVSSTNGIPLVLSGIPADPNLKITGVTGTTVTISSTSSIPAIPAGTILQLGTIPYNTTDPSYPYAIPLDIAVTSATDLSFAKTATINYSGTTQSMPNWIANQSYGPGTITSSTSGTGVYVTFG